MRKLYGDSLPTRKEIEANKIANAKCREAEAAPPTRTQSTVECSDLLNAATEVERRLREDTQPIADLINKHGEKAEKEAWKRAIYGSAIRLQLFTSNAEVGSWGRLEALAKGLEIHGYELSRGIGKDANGDGYNTFDIRRPDVPEWEGVWMGWDADLDDDGDDDELHTLVALMHDAFLSWEDYTKHFRPFSNVPKRL